MTQSLLMEQGLLLIGGGGHCLSVIDMLRVCGLPVAGIVHGDDCDFLPVAGCPALGRDSDLPELRRRFSQALVTVGQIKSAAIRRRLASTLSGLEFFFPVAVSTLAYVSPSAEIGEGSVIMHQALVNASARIGKHCIINSKALVEHGCVVGDFCHVAVGAVLSGDVTIGEGAFVGAGAVIREGVRIGAGSLIGMGLCVRHDIPDGAYYVG